MSHSILACSMCRLSPWGALGEELFPWLVLFVVAVAIALVIWFWRRNRVFFAPPPDPDDAPTGDPTGKPRDHER